MTQEQNSLTDKIAQAETAAKSGLLDDYTPAITANSREPQQQSPTSWGSAMRR